MISPDPAEALSALRVDIDRIDAAMHGLLIERGEIIERLIAVKTAGGGSAFRPGREAEMMRRLAERHRGPLPLDTVESIWRVIISTFTYVQAPYAVHADMAGGDAAMRDAVRFHFGFTVPLHGLGDAGAVLAAVAGADHDLGIVPVAHEGGTGAPWWSRLGGADAPRIIARLPFVERSDHPAGLPVFVIARPAAAAGVRDVLLFAVRTGPAMPAFEPLGGVVLDAGGHGAEEYRLVAVPEPLGAAFAGALRAQDVSVREIGGHAARFTFPSEPADRTP